MVSVRACVRPSRRQFSFTALSSLPHYTALPPLPHYTVLPPLPHYTAIPPLPHYIALPPLPHYNVSAIPLPKFICQNIDISNAKFHRARTFGRINYSRKHLTHSKFSTHGHFTCIPTIVLRINNNPNRILRNNCIQKFREGAQIVFPRLFFEYIIIRIML